MNRSLKLNTIDDFKISAIHTISKGKAVILWLHGITVDKNEYLNFFRDGVKHIETAGADSLRIDFRGHGASSGTSLDFSIVGQMLDVDASIAYLVRHYIKKAFSLHIVACSFGAPPAIFAALRYPEIVKSITLISPVLSYKRTFINPETEWGQSLFNNKTLAALTKTKKLYMNDEFPISIRLIEEMRIIDPEFALKQVKQDIVIIHGDDDTMVPYDVSVNASKSASNIRLITFHGMDHGFTDIEDEVGTSKKSMANKKRIYEIIAEKCT